MAFHYTNSIVSDGRIIILDEPLQTDSRRQLEKIETIDKQELLFLETDQLVTSLEKILKDIVDQNTLLVFPGNGANYPRKESRFCQEFPTTAPVEAQRYWNPGTDPVVTTGLILPERFLILEVKTVVVIDDVISSGLTMRKVYQNNAWKFPAAQWVGTAWLSQLPRGKFVGEYKGIMVSSLVKKSSGDHRVPVNSLSTLRKDSEIAKSYALRHFKNPKEFLHLIRKK